MDFSIFASLDTEEYRVRCLLMQKAKQRNLRAMAEKNEFGF